MIFFECRLDQLSSELAQANTEVERFKADLAGAAEREVALKQQVATAELRAAQALRERNEATERAQLVRSERERILDRLIEAERVRQAGVEAEDDLDLAGFIAELRAEVLELRAARAASGGASPQAMPAAPNAADGTALAASAPPPVEAAVALRTGAFRSAEHAAEKLAADGRLGITDRDREALRSAAAFETRTEETLFALSLRELTSADATSRMRAAQRLKALGPRAALPAAAAALNAETALEVRCALLEVLAAAGEPSVLPLVEPHLHAEAIEVRLAAVEAAVKLKREGALEAALEDGSPLVRRRAAVLAASDANGAPLLQRAARDADASVRRVAVLGLADNAYGAGGGGSARTALLSALDDADPSVRRAAAKGLSRQLGPEVFAVADLDSSHRRREIRRLASLPATAPMAAVAVAAPLRAQPAVAAAPAFVAQAVAAIAPAASVAFAPVAVAATRFAAPPVAGAPGAPGASASAAFASPTAAIRAMAAPQAAPAAPPAAAAGGDAGVESEVLSRIYTALRGLSEEELVRGIGGEPARVLGAAVALERRGRLVRRGQRYFVP